jgi:predicted nucleic acid-binding protein
LSLFVDTSVWSLALRRDRPPDVPEIDALERALATGDLVMTTGLVYQELLQGFHGPRDQEAIVAHFGALPFLTPDRHDHLEAAQPRNRARRRGVHAGARDGREVGRDLARREYAPIAQELQDPTSAGCSCGVWRRSVGGPNRRRE